MWNVGVAFFSERQLEKTSNCDICHFTPVQNWFDNVENVDIKLVTYNNL